MQGLRDEDLPRTGRPLSLIRVSPDPPMPAIRVPQLSLYAIKYGELQSGSRKIEKSEIGRPRPTRGFKKNRSLGNGLRPKHDKSMEGPGDPMTNQETARNLLAKVIMARKGPG